MKWIIILVIYFAIGVGVFARCTNRDKKINPKSVRSLEKILIFPELFLLLVFLLWPFVLFSEIKHKRTASHMGKDDIE